MELRTDSLAQLDIDESVTVLTCGTSPDRPASGTTELSPGWHRVSLDLQVPAEHRGLEWIWTRPDGTREVVPPTRLRHASTGTPGWIPWPAPVAYLPCAT